MDIPQRLKTFSDVLVFDGERFSDATSVTVSGRHIVQVGGRPPEGPEPESYPGATLLPGFIDAHVHIGFFDPRRVLAGGVTAARDTGWPPEEMARTVRLLAKDPSAGPSLKAAGPIITAPGGYPARAAWAPAGTATEVDGPRKARDAVNGLAGWNPAVIKVAQDPRQGPVMDDRTLEMVVSVAHDHGLRVTSHCGSLGELLKALATGVDELAHAPWTEAAIPDRVIARMVEASLTMVPTLHIDPSDLRMDNVRRFIAAGGEVVYGTDMGNEGPPPGIDPEEIRLMVRAGMTVEAALASATSRAAGYLGFEDRGRIVDGAIADLVLVAGDPRDDLGVLGHPLLVMREGT